MHVGTDPAIRTHQIKKPLNCGTKTNAARLAAAPHHFTKKAKVDSRSSRERLFFSMCARGFTSLPSFTDGIISARHRLRCAAVRLWLRDAGLKLSLLFSVR